MNLISILIALGVEIFYKPVSEWRRLDWFGRYHDFLFNKLAGQSLRDGPVGLVVIIGTLVFAVWLLNAMLAGVAWLFSFLFAIVILIYCLGPRDLEEDVKNFMAALERGDTEAAVLHAAEIQDGPPDSDSASLIQHVEENILIQANIRILGVLLWFMLLGPLGAVLFRLSCELKNRLAGEDSAYARAVADLYRILMWLPARLSVLGFALAGSFVDTISNWSSVKDLWQLDNEKFIVISGMGAVRHEMRDDGGNGDSSLDGIHYVSALVKRTLLVWVAVLALLTLTGLVF